MGNVMTGYENGVSVGAQSAANNQWVTGHFGFYDPDQSTAGAQMIDHYCVDTTLAGCDDFALTGVSPASAGGSVIVGEPSIY